MQAKPPRSLQSIEGGIGTLGDQVSPSSGTLFGETEDRPAACCCGAWGPGRGVAYALEQSGDERDTDVEPLGDLTLGAFTFIDHCCYLLPQISFPKRPMASLLLIQSLARKTFAFLNYTEIHPRQHLKVNLR